MQQLIVILAVGAAFIFLGRRLWKALCHSKDLTCGCGCSGCTSPASCDNSRSTLPMHRP